MKDDERKKVEVSFVSNDLVNHCINIDTFEENPIAQRTRSKVETPSRRLVSRSSIRKSTPCFSTPTSKRGRHLTPSSKVTPSTEITTPLRTTRSSNKKPKSCRKLDIGDSTSGSNNCLKVVLPELSDDDINKTEPKVTPIKIFKRKFAIRTSLLNEFLPSEDDVAEVETKPSPIRKLDLSEENIFRSSPRKKNISQKENNSSPQTKSKTPQRSTPSLNINDTPKTGSLMKHQRSLRRTPNTACSKSLFNENVSINTPSATRRKIQKKIQIKKLKEEEDFSSETELTEESDDDFVAEPEESEESDEAISTKRAKLTKKEPLSSPESPAVTNYNIRSQKRVDYRPMIMLDSEKYFENKSQKHTSNNALSTLTIPDITESDINKIISKNYVKHDLKKLMENYRKEFKNWLFYLKEGFNLLMYGVGSKINILKSFQKEMLNECHVVTINGYDPGFTINELFTVLMTDIFERDHCPSNVNEALAAVRNELMENEFPVFIIINSIDGVALKGNKQQAILSKIAELPNIHILASTDHINSPLLWGSNKKSSFHFIWLDVTTFSPYTVEISFGKSLEISNLGSDSSLRTLNNVFKSMNQKTKELFKFILKCYLDHKNEKDFKGILVSDLLRLAKRNFTVSSTFALKNNLKSMIENDFIALKHSYIQILVEKKVLATFYKQQFSNNGHF